MCQAARPRQKLSCMLCCSSRRKSSAWTPYRCGIGNKLNTGTLNLLCDSNHGLLRNLFKYRDSSYITSNSSRLKNYLTKCGDVIVLIHIFITSNFYKLSYHIYGHVTRCFDRYMQQICVIVDFNRNVICSKKQVKCIIVKCLSSPEYPDTLLMKLRPALKSAKTEALFLLLFLLLFLFVWTQNPTCFRKKIKPI